MSKIKEFQMARAAAEKVARHVNYALGRDSHDNDKHLARCHYTGLANQSFTPMGFLVELEYGYYGSSSGYSATSDDMGRYLAKAINANMTMLLDTAAKLAAADVEVARKAAEDEARAVLEVTAA